MTQILDRRLNGKNKSAVNRRRFIRRFKSQIKQKVSEAVNGRSITDIDKGEKVNIPTKDISEPLFGHGSGGHREIIQPGNTDFITGDKIPRPPGSGSGRGSKASNTGEGLDDFVFELSRDEFLEFFFEDLELPDMIKTKLTTVVEHKWVRAGYSTNGIPANISIIRSLRGALARRIAMRAPSMHRLREAEEEITSLRSDNDEDDRQQARIALLEEEMRQLRKRIDNIPFIDTFDLRYNHRIKQPQPSTQAVMFCLMDVSGSMHQKRKDIAKRFFILLYLFLTRTYERIELVFIRHHTTAKEVDENDFFYSRETGGTVVSSALQLMHDIIQDRYPSGEWNIYAAQASDGDNWEGDSPHCREILADKILPYVQYFAYIEITPDRHQTLWREYEKVQSVFGNFAMQEIDALVNIYPVFRELFRKQTT
ncbi:MAG: YeaH/YhbH family protein [Pseudomonadota bacterium]